MGERTRSYSWSEPVAFADSGAETGLAFLEAIIEGRLPAPPIAETLGMRLVEVAEGQAVFETETAEFLLNPLGVVHGGVALTLIDSAAGCAVQTMLPVGVSYTTLETKANFVRPVLSDTGILRCTARAIHVGRFIATAEGRVEGADGRLYAHGTSTLLVLEPAPKNAP